MLAALATPVSAAMAQSPKEVAERVHREGGYPGELPIDADATSGDGRGEATAPRAPEARRRGRDGGSPSLAYLVLGVVLAALVVLFTMLLVRLRPAAEAIPSPSERPRSPHAPAPPAVALVDGDPDELAAQGRFDEALAALVLRALRAVGWQPTGRARGLTAREVLASLGVDHPAREALAGVVTTQERVAFGGEPASRERFDEARRWFTTLTAGSRDAS